MNRYQFIKSSCIAVSAAVLLTACGGGGGGGASSSSSGSSSQSSKGYLIDAAVSGVKYINADGSTGFTNADGSFDYKSGTTRFYVGGVKIGEISQLPSDNKTFIQDIVGVSRSNVSHPEVLKIATFLQSIDSDPNTNEIEIKETEREKFKNHDEDLSNDSSNVTTILTGQGFSVKSQLDVKKHLEDELKENNIVVDTTAPTITSTNTSTKLNTNDDITIKFSENLLVSTITSANFELKKVSSNSVVSSSISYNSVNNTVTINPNANLDYNEQYRLTIKTDVKDNASNSLQSEAVYTFTTNALPDDTKPTVTLTTESSNVLLNQALEIKFSEDMESNTINNTNIILKDNGNNNVASTISYDSSKNSVTITPSQNLNAATQYSIKIKDAVTDLSGNALTTTENNEVVFNFTTISAQQAAAPTISATSLDSNANALAINSNITVTFSKEVDEKTLADNIKLRKDGTNFDVTTGISLNGDKATINPVSLLSKGANYTLTIKNGIKDTYGNNLDYSTDKTYTFSTEQEVDNSRPELVDSESSVKNNDKNVAVDANFEFTFNEDIAANTLQGNGIVLEDASGSAIAKTVTYANKVVTINPDTNLNYSSVYTLKLTSNITDAAGNKYDGETFRPGLDDKIISFTTASDPSDTTAPTLVTATSLGTIDKDTAIVIEFNEELKEINNSNYTNYLDIPYGYLFDKYENKKIYIKVASNAYNTDYKIVLKSDISDLANNTIGSDTEITFKTSLEPDTTAPKILSTVPVSNGTLSGLSTNITITFDEEITASTINATNIKLVKKSDENTNLLTDSNITYSKPTITIDPSSDLENGVEYKVIVKYEGITDLKGNKFEGNTGLSQADYEFSFTASSNVASCGSGFTLFDNKCYKVETTLYTSSTIPVSCNLASRDDIETNTTELATALSLATDKKYIYGPSNSVRKTQKGLFGWTNDYLYSSESGYPICKEN